MKQAKIRYVDTGDGAFVNHSCNDCQKKVDKAIKRTKLVQRGLLGKYITIGGLNAT